MLDKVLLFILVCIFTYLYIKITSKEPNIIKFNFNFFIFYFYCLAIAFIIWPFFLFNPKNVNNSKIGALIAKHITKYYDIKWELRNGEILAEDRGTVVVSNHQSALDVLGLFNIWHVADKIAAIAKKELFYVWPFGLTAYLAGVVFIDRSNPASAYKQLEYTTEIMVKNKTKIWLFPEGTRNKDYRKLLPFKRGAFKIAIAAQVPIIPVVFSPYYFINNKKYIFNKHGHTILQCLKPVPTKGLTTDDIPELIDRVHSQMTEVYKELSKEVFSVLPPDYPCMTFE